MPEYQGIFEEDSDEYKSFVDKFKLKKTTDDCSFLECSPERPTNHFSVPRRTPGASPVLERSPERPPGHLSFPQEDSQSPPVPRAISSP